MITTKPIAIEGQELVLAVALPTTQRTSEMRLALFGQIGWMALSAHCSLLPHALDKRCLRPLNVIARPPRAYRAAIFWPGLRFRRR